MAIIIVQLNHESGALAEVCMDEGEMRELAAVAFQAIRDTADKLVPGQEVVRLTYVDDEGDHCTLSAETIPDAFCFVESCGEGVGKLKVRIVTAGGAPALAPAPVPVPAASTVEQAIHNGIWCDVSGMQPIVGARYNKKGEDYDLCEEEFRKLPKAAKAAFVCIARPGDTPMPVATSECMHHGELPVHHGIWCDVSGMQPIVGARYNKKGEDYDLCEEEFLKLPMAAKAAFVRIACPGDTPVPVATSECKEAGELPVHYGIWCDVSGMHPIVGARYKKKGADYDLCEEEFRKLPSDAQTAFVCIASPAESPVHHGICCDVSGMQPIVGARYNKKGEDYDLCEEEFGKLPKAAKAAFVRIACPGDTPVPVDTSECREAGELPVHHGIWCDVSGMQPIVGARYNKKGEDYDLCEEEFRKLPTAAKAAFVRIACPGDTPVPVDISECREAGELPVHHGIWCDVSGMRPIIGARYNKKGADYDLCEEEFRKLPIDAQTAFVCIASPGESPVPVGAATKGTGREELPVHHGIWCDVSGMRPIVGVRYKKKGEDYDLCEAEFLKIPEVAKQAFQRIDWPGATPLDAVAVGPQATTAEQAIHWNVVCDVTNMYPLLGKRYKKVGEDYDLCEAEFNKLSKESQAEFVCIARPGDTPVPAVAHCNTTSSAACSAEPEATAGARAASPTPCHQHLQNDVMAAAFERLLQHPDSAVRAAAHQAIEDAKVAIRNRAAPAPRREPVVHEGVACDITGMCPIVGVRYKKRGEDYDLCEEEFEKLSEDERAAFIRIPHPRCHAAVIEEIECRHAWGPSCLAAVVHSPVVALLESMSKQFPPEQLEKVAAVLEPAFGVSGDCVLPCLNELQKQIGTLRPAIEAALEAGDVDQAIAGICTCCQEVVARSEELKADADAAVEDLMCQLEGCYECHLYDKDGKNDWHFVELGRSPDRCRMTWSNRAGVSWALTPSFDAEGVPKLLVATDCPYFGEGHHVCELDRDDTGRIVGVFGPGQELYSRSNIESEQSDIATTEALSNGGDVSCMVEATSVSVETFSDVSSETHFEDVPWVVCDQHGELEEVHM